jgi:hypothetical protein
VLNLNPLTPSLFEFAPVRGGDALHDFAASCPGYPPCPPVQPIERRPYVRILGDETFGLRERGVVDVRAGQLVEAAFFVRRGPFQRGIEDLLHGCLRQHLGALVPGRHGADADAEVLGERLVGQPQRRLQRACGLAGPRNDWIHDSAAPDCVVRMPSALSMHRRCTGDAWDFLLSRS